MKISVSKLDCESWYRMKYEGEFAGSIKDIGFNEFYFIYVSPMQIDIYKDAIKTVRRVLIDGTGSVVRSMKKPNGEKCVFLYQTVMSNEGKIKPIYQMVSTKHDTSSLTYWLSMFLKQVDRVSPEVVSDFSLALLNAITLSFNECRLSAYITSCLHMLRGEKNQRPLRCYIMLDVAHLKDVV